MADYRDYIGYLKYEGASVAEGFLDARKSGEALIGFDESLRFFLTQEGVTSIDFEIPVKIRKGSWEALIGMSGLALMGSAGIVATAYLATAVQTIAANDLKHVTSVDLMRGAIKKMQSVIKIAKHVGGLAVRDIKGVTWLDQNRTVSIPDTAGKELRITTTELESYINCPSRLLAKMAAVIETDRSLKIGVIEDGKVTEIEIDKDSKEFFYTEPGVGEEILPELKDGSIVMLIGKITRGNEKTNGIGIEYKDHILNCRPEKGTVVQYKQYLFTRCRLQGIVDRKTNPGLDKKPQIIILEIVSLERDSGQSSML